MPNQREDEKERISNLKLKRETVAEDQMEDAKL